MYKTIYSRRYASLLATLVDARKERAMTQAALARRLRQTQSWVSKCERGERRLDVVELELWCEALGVDFALVLRRHRKGAVTLPK
jgi:transcriptional regulator with XRE-family HTH domain